ncbi:MAG TPA: DUF2442 domain-containing protein [Chitinophagales bacterium]
MKGKNLWFEKDLMYVEFDNGQILGTPVSMFPILKNATKTEREKWRFNPFGIMWDEIDEAVSFEFLLSDKKDEYLVYNPDRKSIPVAKKRVVKSRTSRAKIAA